MLNKSREDYTKLDQKFQTVLMERDTAVDKFIELKTHYQKALNEWDQQQHLFNEKTQESINGLMRSVDEKSSANHALKSELKALECKINNAENQHNTKTRNSIENLKLDLNRTKHELYQAKKAKMDALNKVSELQDELLQERSKHRTSYSGKSIF